MTIWSITLLKTSVTLHVFIGYRWWMESIFHYSLLLEVEAVATAANQKPQKKWWTGIPASLAAMENQALQVTLMCLSAVLLINYRLSVLCSKWFKLILACYYWTRLMLGLFHLANSSQWREAENIAKRGDIIYLFFSFMWTVGAIILFTWISGLLMKKMLLMVFLSLDTDILIFFSACVSK